MTIQGYPDPGDGLRLHLNENTGGCSPRVLEAIRRVQTSDVSTYPSYPALVRACARALRRRSRLGAADQRPRRRHPDGRGRPHRAHARATTRKRSFRCRRSIRIRTPRRAVGATAVRIPPRPGFVFQTDEVIAAITPRTRMIFLNTPNNPTGPADPARRSAAASPRRRRTRSCSSTRPTSSSAAQTFLPELPRYPNVLVGRTFSKAYGLAGMRVGIVIGQPQALDAVRAVTLPFNINGVALAATLAALEDTDFLPRYAAQVAESRTRLYAACRALGLTFWESAANFVLVRVGDAVPLVVQALAARGVHVRDRSKDPTTPGCIRITAGMLDHTTAAIEALESVAAGRQR